MKKHDTTRFSKLRRWFNPGNRPKACTDRSRSNAIPFFLILTVFCFTVNTTQAQTFTQFKFSAKSLGWNESEKDFEGEIDDENLTITFATQRWIGNIANLSAIFEVECADDCETQDCDVKVGDDVQMSGETENDFGKEVVYTICGDVQYTVRFVSPQTTGIPVIKIETQNGVEVTSKENWTNMTSFTLIDPNDDTNNISLGMYGSQYHRIRGRGNSTWTYPKKPYRLRFREDISLFGKAARENWILLAEYLDPTFLTTAVAFELGGSVFQMPYTCTYQPVHVYYNGRYDGLYTLTEHRQADPNGPPGAPGRVGIDQANEGWFIEIDDNYDEDPKFKTVSYNLPIMIKAPEYAPEPEDSDNPFYDFIKNDMNQLCDSMLSPGFPENGYRDLLDMNAFIDFLMVNEIVLNIDIAHFDPSTGETQPRSCFAYKIDKDGKISMGPLWDFDWAFSFARYGHFYFTNYSGRLPKPTFFLRLFEDPVFVAKYKERWIEKYDEIVVIADYIETQGTAIRAAALEDAKRWFIPGGYRPEYDPDHARQIEAMKTWWKNRVSWLNTELNRIETLPRSKDFGSIFKDESYSDILPQTFSLVAYGAVDNLTVKLKDGELSGYEITTTDIQVQTTGNGGYYATLTVQLKDGLTLGTYYDELIFSGTNRGSNFSVSVPLRFAITKFEQELFALDEVEDKVFGDENFFLTATGGSGSGKITFEVVSGNADIDENTGEVEITGAGDIVVVATKAEDEDYQQAQSQLTIPVAKAIPSFIIPVDLVAACGDSLSSVVLPENWAWEDDMALVGDDVGMYTFKAIYTPADTFNYIVVTDIEVTIKVTVTDIKLPTLNPLRAWMRNGSLHVTGITPGETLSIYNIMGMLVYHRIATSDEMDIPLRAQGVYFVRSGNHTVKIVCFESGLIE